MDGGYAISCLASRVPIPTSTPFYPSTPEIYPVSPTSWLRIPTYPAYCKHTSTAATTASAAASSPSFSEYPCTCTSRAGDFGGKSCAWEGDTRRSGACSGMGYRTQRTCSSSYCQAELVSKSDDMIVNEARGHAKVCGDLWGP